MVQRIVQMVRSSSVLSGCTNLKHQWSDQSPETLLHYLHRFSNFGLLGVCLNSKLSTCSFYMSVFSTGSHSLGSHLKVHIILILRSWSKFQAISSFTIPRVHNSISKGFISAATTSACVLDLYN